MFHRFALLTTTCVTWCGAVSYALVPAPGLAQTLKTTATPLSVDPLIPSGSSDFGLLSQAVSPAASQPTAPDSSEILLLGSRGEQVKALQTLLQRQGHSVPVDGLFGDQTKSAVIDFQRRFGLPVDGQVGSATWQRLRQGAASAGNPSTASAPPDSAIQDSAPAADPAADTPATPAAASPEQPSPTAAASAAAAPAETAANAQGSLPWLWIAIGAGGASVLGLAGLYGLGRWKKIQKPPVAARPAARYAPPTSGAGLSGLPGLNSEQRTETERTVSGSNAMPVELSSEPSGEPANQPASLNGVVNGRTESVVEVSPEQPLQPLQPMQPMQQMVSSHGEVTRMQKVNIGDELIKDLRSGDPARRRKAIWELGQQGDSRAIQPLVDLMVDADSQQRSLILASVSEICMRSLKPMSRALMLSLQDDSADVRKNAIRDVTRVYEMMGQISQVLRHASDDDDAEVRETANWALSQLNRVRTLSGGDAAGALPDTARTVESLPADNSGHRLEG